MQVDWVGNIKRPVFKDIGNQRASTAQEKAQLCKLIGDVCNRIPPEIIGGSVQRVREWKAKREAAMKVASSKRSTVHELTAALSHMGAYQP